MNRKLRLLLVGDVGRSVGYHVGDDAMLYGLLSAAQTAEVELDATMTAADPTTATERFGIPAVPLAGFDRCTDRDARAELLATGALPPATAAALEHSDAVVITGGGNISRSWPHLVYERLALARAAWARGLPVVLTGQGLGPWFGDETAPLTMELLRGATWVCVRERSSLWLAGQLGVPETRVLLGGDDAQALPPTVPSRLPIEPFVAVTINDLGAEPLAEVAAQLMTIRARLGCRIVLVPHAGTLTEDGTSEPTGGDDVAVAHRLAGLVDAEVAALPTAGDAIGYCAQAELVISSRYHPVVFALAHGRPVIFLPQDSYTAMKGVGALELAGLADWQLPVSRLAQLSDAVTELWHRRGEIADYLADIVTATEHGMLGWLLRNLAGETDPPPAAPPVRSGPTPGSEWAAQPRPNTLLGWYEADVAALEGRYQQVTRAQTEQHEQASAHLATLSERAEKAERYADSLLERAEAAESYLAAVTGRAEVAEEFAASLVGRAEVAERYAASLQQELARRDHRAAPEVRP